MGKLGIWVALVSFIHLPYLSAAEDTMSQHQTLGEGQTLLSARGTFELGFFKPGNSSNRYVGIWYKGYTGFPSRQIVWVANRETPINSSGNGSLIITPDGNLNILDSNKIVWSTGTPGAVVSDTYVLQLLESGNLVLNDWQSFDYPSHALLPGMKIGNDFSANREWHLTSWKSEYDPSPGPYTYIMYPKGPPEVYVINGSTRIWRSGTWNGQGWDGIPTMNSDTYFNFEIISGKDELYYQFEMRNKSITSRLLLRVDGVLERWVWREQKWNLYWKLPADVCDTYLVCGGYGVCQNDNSPVAYCSCLKGFEPVDSVGWGLRDWSHGCTRRTPLSCEKGDGFVTVGQLKLPDTTNTSWDSGKGIDECREWCLQNCSCLAYAVTGEGGSGCIIWFGELIDIREFTEGGQDLYVRVASSEIVDESFRHIKKPVLIIKCVVISSVVILFISLSIFWLRQRKGKRNLNQLEISTACDNYHDHEVNRYGERTDDVTKDQDLDHGLLLFTFSTITTCTNNFSDENKIGEGGFGPVYMGIMRPKGQEIAIKRLSRGSIQGVDEFKNEIKLIANLQHKNLVRLLGCCIKDEERILVYEYMPNRSLDCFLFDPIKSATLDWKTRIRIIHGVAQGLLYLHTYSRLRIIHRDLKSGNILLDSEMNPKISDFGIARIFGGNQDLASTSRVVGTYGYMPPEYALEGWFSEKSDVFSFGVLLLEIVSGKRNYGAPQIGRSLFLTGYVWSLWKEGCVSEILDPVLRELCPLQDLLRYVHVGLLCVQEEASERPNMSTIICFLSSNIFKLPTPKEVAFFNQRRTGHLEEFCYSNGLTMTAPSPL